MKEIYIVQGETGEYSDQQSWLVCAYSDPESAERRLALCRREAARIDQWLKAHPDETYANHTSPADPNFRRDYTGTTYDVISVPFEGNERI